MANPVLAGGVGSPLAIYESSTTQYHRLGERGILSDRVFHYARVNGTAIGPNLMCQSAAPVANHTTQTGAINGSGGQLVAGQKVFTALLGATAATANQYEDGFFKVQSSTLGTGQIYRLNKHGAVGSAATGTFEMEYPVVTATTGTLTWTLLRNQWADVVVAPTSATAAVSGVTLVSTGTGTDATPQYVWLQTWGPTSVLIDTVDVVLGTQLIRSAATAGAVTTATLDGNAATSLPQVVGVALETIATNSIYASVFLTIAP